MNFIKKFLSRKLMLAILGIIIEKILATEFGSTMDPEVLITLMASVGTITLAGIGGLAWVDAKIDPEDLEIVRKLNGGKK